MPLRPLDSAERRRHKLRNTLHTWLLGAGGLALLALCGYALAGWTGAIWTIVAGLVSLALAAQASPAALLRVYRAQRLSAREAPDLVAIVAELARRAALPAAPKIFYVPSQAMNAFAVGRPEDSAIAITDGLIRGLSLRQIAGVLAHEISHVRNGDLRIMALADMVSRMTSLMFTLGVILFFLNLPILLLGGEAIPWGGALLLIAAPSIAALIQLALSRTREYDADLDAAGLTGDPEALAEALTALERRRAGAWEAMLPPAPRAPDPSLLRTHPSTAERVRRLLSLRGLKRAEPAYANFFEDGGAAAAQSFAPVARAPRMRLTGVWY